MAFNGFPEKMQDFLHENKIRNSKAWYNDHKALYKDLVYNPFAEFVRELAPTMSKIDNYIVTEPRFCLCHIFRDTRFSKDKSSLYRENMWITFKRPAKTYPDGPAFYFEILPDYVQWGMGYWCASAAVLARYRAFILRYPDEFRKIIAPIKHLQPSVEHYKRKFADAPDNDLYEWYISKGVHVTAGTTNFSKIYNGSIAETVRRAYVEAGELYNLMFRVKDMPELVEDTPSIPKNNVTDFEW